MGGSISGAELANKAYEGVYVEAGKSYRFSLWANKGSYEGDIRVSVSKDGAEAITGALVCEEDTVREDGWAKYSAVLEAAETMEKAEFTVALETLAEGEYADIDMVSMFPDDAVEGIFRRDLAEFIKEINPGFLRFPGGCAVEGYNLSNRYRWKDTVGPVEERPQTWNRWGNKNGTYNETYGLGFFEYFILCEYLDCKALPILNVGMACEYNTMEMVPLYEDDGVTYTEEFMEYVQDAVDLIEFANGGIDTEWGRVRAEMGHPEPFNLEMIGIGNEQWEKNDADGVSNQWFERYEAFEKFIHEEYPDMKLITSAGPDVGSSKHTSAWTWVYQKSAENLGFTAAVDEHNYNTIEWLLENDDFYDSYSRKVPVYLGEYAAKGYSTEDGKKHSNDLVSAVAEAAFLTGIERNADVVKMASYAPLFAREGYTQWGPDMIFFNDTSVYGTPNYYVQKMYSNNMGDYTLKTDIVSPSEQRIYRTVSYDEENREIIVKLVNPGERMQTAEINIDSEYNLSGHMTKKLLTSENAVDINSFGDPENVSEQISESNDAADNMLVDMPAYSFTILRISVQ